jgi:hypothetical protein
MSTPNGMSFRLVCSKAVLDKVKVLHKQAKDSGQESTFLSALKSIVANLREQPLQFGEQRFTLPHLNLEVRVGAVPPLLVVFGVHKEKAIVFVRDLLSLPGSSF